MRQLNREKNPNCHEIIRRFTADEEDFAEKDIEYLSPDMFITNNEGTDINHIAEIIAQARAQGQF